jgi:hypothetical protein
VVGLGPARDRRETGAGPARDRRTEAIGKGQLGEIVVPLVKQALPRNKNVF